MEKVFLVNDLEESKKIAAKIGSVAAIEAEYGDEELGLNDEGVLFALNHHGPRSNQPCPSERFDLSGEGKEAKASYILSHIDLDSIIGVMHLEGEYPNTEYSKKFAEFAAFVDLNGPHMADKHPYYNEVGINWLYNRMSAGKIKTPMIPRGELSIEITEFVQSAIENTKNAIDGVFDKNEVLEWQEKQNKILQEGLLQDLSVKNLIHVFDSNSNCSSAYRVELPNGEVSRSEFNVQLTKFKTISLASLNEDSASKIGKNGVIEVLQEVFGDKAGGRKTIGGSPRDLECGINDLKNVVKVLKNKLKQK